MTIFFLFVLGIDTSHQVFANINKLCSCRWNRCRRVTCKRNGRGILSHETWKNGSDSIYLLLIVTHSFRLLYSQGCYKICPGLDVTFITTLSRAMIWCSSTNYLCERLYTRVLLIRYMRHGFALFELLRECILELALIYFPCSCSWLQVMCRVRIACVPTILIPPMTTISPCLRSMIQTKILNTTTILLMWRRTVIRVYTRGFLPTYAW